MLRVPLINFSNDMICGYIEVGFVRAVNVLITIAAMSFGIVAAIYICGIDNFVKGLSMTPHNNHLALVKHMSTVWLAYAVRMVGICRTYGWHMSYVLSAYVSHPPQAHTKPV